jgi:hypothetical protein
LQSSIEGGVDRFPLLLWEGVLVPLLLLFGLMTHPGIYQTLVDAAAGADRCKAMTERVPARHHVSFTSL